MSLFPLHPSRRLPWIVTLFLLLLGTGTAAYAFWAATTSSSNAAAAADALAPGSKPAVTASGTALTVTWAGGTTVNGRPATGYTVTRYSAATGGTASAATGGCAGTLTTLSCTEQNVPGGIWYYTVTPAIALWTGAESPRSNGTSNDSTAPVATVSGISPTPNTAGWNRTSPVTVSITADDGASGSGVVSISYTLDGGAQQTVNGSVATIPVSGEGTHTVSYFATDKVGNAGSTQTQTVRIDTQAPAAPGLTVPVYVNLANVAAVPVSGTTEAGAKITLTAADAGAAHSAPPVTATADGTGKWSATLNLGSLDQGTVTYSATATDAAGNVSAAKTGTSTKDTLAPAAAQAVNVPSYVNIGNVAAVPVSGTAEAGSTVTVSATSPGTATPVTGMATAATGGAWSANMNLGTLAQGVVTYTVTVTDAAGNSSTPVTASNTKDTVAPVLKLDTPPSILAASVSSYAVGGTNDSNTTVSVSVTDGTTTVTGTASGTIWNTGALNLTTLKDTSVTAPVVTLSITATTTDAAGNSTTVMSAVTKDTKTPTVTDISLANGGSTNANKSSADAGDTVTIKFSEKLDLAKICANWTGGQRSGSATITDNGTNDALSFSFSGCSLGSVALNANYLTGNPATFGANGTQSSLNWDPANNALVIKFGNDPNGSSGAGTLHAGVVPGKPTYTPGTGFTDQAGNPLGSTPFTSTTATGFAP